MSKHESISTQGLSIGYGKGSKQKILLHDLNLNFLPGEFVAIIGPNGVGKSTLLRTLAGLQASLSGQIFILGTPFSQFKQRELAKKIAFVSTEWIQLSHLRVYDLVALGRYPHSNWLGSLSETDKKSITEALEISGLIKLQNRYYDELSDGERQRVMVARALAQESNILIMDEPAAFLDIAHKYELIRTLSKISKEKNKLILFSVHDLDLAVKEADRLLLINTNGISSGAPEDLILNGIFTKTFSEALLRFDLESGEFFLPRQTKASILVNGYGHRLGWTIKALERANYKTLQTESNTAISLEVIVEKNHWILRTRQRTTEHSSIESLLKTIGLETTL